MAGFIQRLITRLMPKRAAEIERQSREWNVVCSQCGHIRSYWDIGGVRYKAKSTAKRVGLHCPVCGEGRMHDVVRAGADAPDTAG